jgi:hypothetical protein
MEATWNVLQNLTEFEKKKKKGKAIHITGTNIIYI